MPSRVPRRWYMLVRSLIMERMSPRLSVQTQVVSRMEAHDVATALDRLCCKQGVGGSGGSESRWCKDCGVLVVLKYHNCLVVLVDGSVGAHSP